MHNIPGSAASRIWQWSKLFNTHCQFPNPISYFWNTGQDYFNLNLWTFWPCSCGIIELSRLRKRRVFDNLLHTREMSRDIHPKWDEVSSKRQINTYHLLWKKRYLFHEPMSTCSGFAPLDPYSWIIVLWEGIMNQTRQDRFDQCILWHHQGCFWQERDNRVWVPKERVTRFLYMSSYLDKSARIR